MSQTKTLIVGAGISGLATAGFIGRGGDLLVLEADSGVGGYCETVKRRGRTFEWSPRSRRCPTPAGPGDGDVHGVIGSTSGVTPRSTSSKAPRAWCPLSTFREFDS
jgi:hypothetical protein